MKTSFPIENRAALTAKAFASLSKPVAGHRSIKHALDWLTTHQPPIPLLDMVTQDEFSHDILVRYSEGLYLVYDVT